MDSVPLCAEGLMMKTQIKGLILCFSIATLFITAKEGISADPSALSVSGSVLSKNKCKFQTKASALDYGNLDPASSVDVTAVTTLGFVCNGSTPSATFLMTQDNGLNATGPGNNRMQHTSILTEFLPYSLALSPSSATVPKGLTQTLTVTGTVNFVDYQSATFGSYSDTVVITITP